MTTHTATRNSDLPAAGSRAEAYALQASIEDTLTGPVARTLFALPFLVFGLMHFPGAEAMAGYVPSWVPGPVFWVYLTGVAMIAAAVAISIGKLARAAAYGLALLMATFAFTVHLPGLFDEASAQMATISFLKDISLGAAALFIGGHFARRDR